MMTTERRLKIFQALKGNGVYPAERKDLNSYIYHHDKNNIIEVFSAVLETPFGNQVKEFQNFKLYKDDYFTITWQFDINGVPIDLPKNLKCWIIYR